MFCPASSILYIIIAPITITAGMYQISDNDFEQTLHKMKNDNYICHATYLRNNIVYDHGFWYTCVKWWYVQGFFYILIFWAVMWVKGQKIAQNKKRQLYLSCNISQEQYSLWSWLLVHLCKMIICPGFFFIFSFFGLLWG